jgi:hypothetical protein
MKQSLAGKKIAILVTDGFEQVELTEPREALDQAGATTTIVSPGATQVKGWDEDDFGDTFDVDLQLEEASPDDFDALLLPGGVMNPDKLRALPEAVSFVKSFFTAASRSRPSATARSCSSRPAWSRAASSPRSRRSRPISAMPAPTGSIRRSSPIRASSPAASPPTFPPSTKR